jgi:hypothetical protein
MDDAEFWSKLGRHLLAIVRLIEKRWGVTVSKD